MDGAPRIGRPRWRPALALLAAAATLALACGGDAAAEPTTHTVTMDATSFTPAQLDVRVGDTVVWVNDDLLVHTVTAAAGGPDSGDIAPGTSWQYTAREAGDFAYACDYHPPMRGFLRVR